MNYIGITETSDPCFHPDWETRLLAANIIISKELSFEMTEKLLIVQDRVQQGAHVEAVGANVAVDAQQAGDNAQHRHNGDVGQKK